MAPLPPVAAAFRVGDTYGRAHARDPPCRGSRAQSPVQPLSPVGEGKKRAQGITAPIVHIRCRSGWTAAGKSSPGPCRCCRAAAVPSFLRGMARPVVGMHHKFSPCTTTTTWAVCRFRATWACSARARERREGNADCQTPAPLGKSGREGMHPNTLWT